MGQPPVRVTPAQSRRDPDPIYRPVAQLQATERLDRAIIPLLNALTERGFLTVSSCAGHRQRGKSTWPWVILTGPTRRLEALAFSLLDHATADLSGMTFDLGRSPIGPTLCLYWSNGEGPLSNARLLELANRLRALPTERGEQSSSRGRSPFALLDHASTNARRPGPKPTSGHRHESSDTAANTIDWRRGQGWSATVSVFRRVPTFNWRSERFASYQFLPPCSWFYRADSFGVLARRMLAAWTEASSLRARCERAGIARPAIGMPSTRPIRTRRSF